MRISDWSSDVCSSDLDHRHLHRRRIAVETADGAGDRSALADGRAFRSVARRTPAAHHGRAVPRRAAPLCAAGRVRTGEIGGRSEEHTPELQSLMRISYAVFCLKKKKKTEHTTTTKTHQHRI